MSKLACEVSWKSMSCNIRRQEGIFIKVMRRCRMSRLATLLCMLQVCSAGLNTVIKGMTFWLRLSARLTCGYCGGSDSFIQFSFIICDSSEGFFSLRVLHKLLGEACLPAHVAPNKSVQRHWTVLQVYDAARQVCEFSHCWVQSLDKDLRIFLLLRAESVWQNSYCGSGIYIVAWHTLLSKAINTKKHQIAVFCSGHFSINRKMKKATNLTFFLDETAQL